MPVKLLKIPVNTLKNTSQPIKSMVNPLKDYRLTISNISVKLLKIPVNSLKKYRSTNKIAG